MAAVMRTFKAQILWVCPSKTQENTGIHFFYEITDDHILTLILLSFFWIF